MKRNFSVSPCHDTSDSGPERPAYGSGTNASGSMSISESTRKSSG